MNDLHIDLPESSPYQCGNDFSLEQEENGLISWSGIGRFEGDHCGFEAYRTVEQATADAVSVFRLAIADGWDRSEALMAA